MQTRGKKTALPPALQTRKASPVAKPKGKASKKKAVSVPVDQPQPSTSTANGSVTVADLAQQVQNLTALVMAQSNKLDQTNDKLLHSASKSKRRHESSDSENDSSDTDSCVNDESSSDDDDQVTGEVWGNDEVSNVEDEVPQGPPTSLKSNMNYSSVQFHARVPPKLRQKIWNSRYIDLDLLFQATRHPTFLFQIKKKKKIQKKIKHITNVRNPFHTGLGGSFSVVHSCVHSETPQKCPWDDAL